MIAKEDPVGVLSDCAQHQRVASKLARQIVECQLQRSRNVVGLHPDVQHLSTPLMRSYDVIRALYVRWNENVEPNLANKANFFPTIDSKELLAQQVNSIVDSKHALEFTSSRYL